jgi:dipeptidyl-peptidase-4
VFAAGLSVAPVTDWRLYDTIYTERFMRTPQENEDGYDAGSCLTYAKDLRGHLLVMHGLVDDNVHPNNSWQLADKLQDAGKDFDMMWYPDSGHGLARHSSQVKWRYLYDALIDG